MNFPFRRRLGVVVSAFAAALLLCNFSALHAQENLIPRLPAGAVDAGPLPGSQSLSITLHLSPSPDHDAALLQFLSDVQTPGSPVYHQWLTPAQFGAQFGVTPTQMAGINSFAAANGLTVSNISASGLRVTLTGTAAGFESAMAPALHQIQLAGNLYFANTAIPALPSAFSAQVTGVDGLSTLPSAHPMTIAGTVADDPLTVFGAVIDANALRVFSVSGDACLEDFSTATQTALQNELRQAAAQGMTVLAASGCGSRGSAGFPSALSEVTAVAVAPGITPAANPVLSELRPGWQSALGLPADSFRHEVDLTVSSIEALTQKVASVIATQTENNAPLRLGNINATLYINAATKGLFTQPDNATPGTWEAATGLGLADLNILGNIIWQPHGTHNSQTTVFLNTTNTTHGQTVSVYATIVDPSFSLGFPPTGNVTFTVNPSSGAFVGTEPTNNGTSQTYSSNQLNSGNYQVIGSYFGDGTYAGSTGSAGIYIAPEPSVLSATSPGTANLGQTFTVVVTDKSGSGVDTPYGTITITEYGSTTLTYTQNLVAAGTGVATATFNIPAAQGGTLNLSINCNSGGNPNFTCFTPISVPFTVNKAATTTTLISNPANPQAGQTIALQATVVMATPVSGFNAVFTGNVTFYDNGTNLGSTNISGSGLATLVTSLAGASDTVTAVYSGDANFLFSTGTLNGTGGGGGGTAKTTTTLSVNPATGLANSNYIVTATVTNSGTTGGAPSGSVTFSDSFNGVSSTLGTASLAASGSSVSLAQLSISGLAAGTHTISANYSGSSTFGGSSSNTVALNLTDYSITFSPASMTLSVGSSGTDTVTVNALNGFKGTVTLSCTAPAATQTTCAFTPATITNSGSSQLLITTTKPSAIKSVGHAGFDGKILGAALTTLLIGLLLPSVRRRRPALLALLVTCVLLSSSGCTVLNNVATIIPPSGTPLGTQLFTINTSGTDGTTTTHHDVKLQVTVQ